MRKLLALAFCFSALAFAQFDTAVTGAIRDNSGAFVSKAAISLLNPETGSEAKTTTDDNGNYTFENVKAGTYTVTADAPGFTHAIAKDVAVAVNARQRVDFTLQVGATSDSVEVTAGVALLDTDTSERGQLVNTKEVIELPLNGRAYSDLALLTSGVTKSPSATTGTPREGSLIVNGLRSVYNNFILDGIDNNAYGTSNQGFANQVAQPSPDGVQEFRVITNNYSAEYGRSGGATINVVTRSGTNQLHGSAYDFLRNTDLNAVGFFKPKLGIKPTLQQNQFGATIGGPIRANKIFFFGDYEGFRSLQRVLNFDTIPNMNDRIGLLPVTVVNPQTGVVYPANTPIPPSATTNFARTVLGNLPAVAPGTTRSNNYQALLLTRNYNDKFDAKIDGQINDRMSAFLRLTQRKVNIFNQPDIPGPSGGNGNGYTRVLNQQGDAAYTWTIGGNSILEARFGISRTVAGKQPFAIGGTSVLDLYGITGLPTDPSLTGGLTPTTLSGFSQLGRQATNPQFQYPTVFDPKINFSKLVGRHSLKFGFEELLIRTEVLDVNPLYGRDAYAGAFTKPTCAQLGQAAGCAIPNDAASYSIADFLFGLRSQYALGTDLVGNYRQHIPSLYGQDDFRVNANLTLNLGLRWEYGSPLVERDNRMSNFDPATNSIVFAKDGGISDRALVNPDYKDFAPRVGFAYSAGPKTVFRGGYGISYIHYNRVGSANLLGINGPQVVIATVNQSNPLDPNFRTTQQGYPDGFATPANFNPINANITYVPKDLRTPYVQSWFFSMQRQIIKDTVLDVAYVGNHSVALPVIGDYNQAFPQATATSKVALQLRRPDQSFGAITWYDPAGFSNYNSLQIKLEHRAGWGLYFLNSFTWSKALDNSAQSLDTSNGNQASPQDIRNLASEKGVSNYDQTYNNITTAVYDIPFQRAKPWGGWEISAINTAQSALPINLRAWVGSVPSAFQTVGNLPDYRGGESFRPNVAGPVLTGGSLNIDQYFNTANVSLPTDPSHPFGNAGRNSTRATPFNQLDLGVNKNFKLPFESAKLQFRSEFFNLFNHTNFTAANSDRASSAFGTIRGTYPPRYIQFALKLMF